MNPMVTSNQKPAIDTQKLQRKENQAYRYREQTGGCQDGGGAAKWVKGSKGAHTLPAIK